MGGAALGEWCCVVTSVNGDVEGCGEDETRWQRRCSNRHVSKSFQESVINYLSKRLSTPGLNVELGL